MLFNPGEQSRLPLSICGFTCWWRKCLGSARLIHNKAITYKQKKDNIVLLIRMLYGYARLNFSKSRLNIQSIELIIYVISLSTVYVYASLCTFVITCRGVPRPFQLGGGVRVGFTDVSPLKNRVLLLMTRS